ncbi:hypothetical protein P280DRAFT_545313 [Massarina eburnea CBS 473.64]|uniref:F-box domain-containing protein n=1 Tax=Massarina eburnea CBS 473.64 TaxID=1395130 RepID=A0A6A6SC36_9PLEO|nr:hypothetical protein P280DRAFT_545313 [Massarina eburnea CBS 473.64]
MKLRRPRSHRSPPPSNPSTSPKPGDKKIPNIYPQPQPAPILTLPLELLQQISSYLPPTTTASFSLTTRYIYYAIGTLPLQTHLTHPSSPSPCTLSEPYLPRSLSAPLSRIERRKRLEILEQAFPSHWYCAWCDRFHARALLGGPKTFLREVKRDCAEFNSYLHHGWGYVLCFHHVRLAVNRALWGPEFGLGEEDFLFEEGVRGKRVGRLGGVALWLRIRGKVVKGRFLLCAGFRVGFKDGGGSLLARDVVSLVLPLLPQIVAGHRDSHGPHTGLARAIEKALLSPLSSSSSSACRGNAGETEQCSFCATDFSISSSHPLSSSGNEAAKTVLEISVWRDLGDGRSPFDMGWRAHGELGNGKTGLGAYVARGLGVEVGGIRRRFEER